MYGENLKMDSIYQLKTGEFVDLARIVKIEISPT